MVVHKIVTYHHEKVKVYCDSRILSPFLLGILNPLIYVPCNISEETLLYVIAHEKSHIKRKDYLLKPLFFVAVSIHWINPMVWVAYIMFCRDIELACDERVIRDNKEMDKIVYSETLLLCASQKSYMNISVASFGENGVKKRVKNILNYKKPRKSIVSIGVAVCLSVSVFFIADSTKAVKAENGNETQIKKSDMNELVTNQLSDALVMKQLLEFMSVKNDKASETKNVESEVDNQTDYEDNQSDHEVGQEYNENSNIKVEESNASENIFETKQNGIEGVSMQVIESNSHFVTVQLDNNTDKEYVYGEDYALERYDEEKHEWVDIPFIGDGIISDVGFLLLGRSTRSWSVDVTKFYGELSSGRYRILKEIIASGEPWYYYAAEFEI